MKIMEPQTNFRELIDAYLKENCKENTYAMYSATLLDPNVKRVQILRKLFGLPAEGKAIADLTLKEMQELDKKLGDHIRSSSDNKQDNENIKNPKKKKNAEKVSLSEKYASDIRSHLRKCIDFLENLNERTVAQNIKSANDLMQRKEYYIKGEIRSISYMFCGKESQNKKFTFVPDQEYSLEEKAERKKAVFVPFEPENNVDAYILPYERELDVEIDADVAAIFPEKILGPVTLVLETTFGFEGNTKIMYKNHQIFTGFDCIEITVLKNSRNAY